jgi:hypothetical protein
MNFDPETFAALAKLLDSSSNFALLLCVYFIQKSAERLSRIEKALDLYLQKVDLKDPRS